ncbi:PAS domain-containing hybrid sensor histidine kinase/response regulator [Maribacter arcticus]|uniref:histidine kinase n=1 Tax=Maribacter arcticus TaxID=561365 RepID=A0A1T5CEC2_9FLAO|nr:PAS domain-containing hybrid sensor histidine kinase/response regulator [Maribacter arcticus]SKB57683.1 PAS domain S-box-containing protein [Maribacter arcticus]
MNLYTTILLEFLLISSSILFLFKYRTKLGLAPLYILLGSVQYLQALSGSMVSFKIFEEYPIYPGSVIIFSAVLFAILLIYIKEGVASARTLIIGIIISNAILSALFGITYVQEHATQIISLEDPSSIFQINYKYFITGTIILFIDFFLLVIIYQFLISKLNKLYFFLILFISLCFVLLFDSLAFNILLKYGTPIFTTSLIGHIIGKSFSAVIFSLILYIYLKFIDKEEDNAGFIAAQNREIFSILTYRKKYFNLKEEKQKVEKKFISQIESTLNQISDGFVSLDNDWCYTYVNKKAGEFLGRSPESLIGKYIWTEFPKGVDLPFYHAYHKAVKTQQTQYLTEYYEAFDKWIENRIYPTPDGLSIYFTDFTERKTAEIALKESEKYLDNIIDNIGDPVFVKDSESQLLLVNDAFCKIFNVTRKDVIGKTLAENVPPEERESFLRIDKQVILTGVENVNEETLSLIGKETQIISTKKTRFVDSNGTKFLIGVIRDITERKKAEIELEKHRNNLEGLVELRTNELEKEKIKAQSADLMKSAFLATMSHELRTPMNSIIGFTGILLNELAGPINDEQKRQLGMVKNSGQHLLGLINDVLDISKIEAGKLKVSLDHFNYLTTLEKTIDFLLPQASKKELQILLEISVLNITLNSDERRVEQVLLNLLSNAIKFSNQGAITVKVDIVDGLVVTQVIDQGIGISKKDLHKLFEPFIQLEHGLNRSHEGTGLGLAICKSLIEKLGGTINVQSKKGVGSNFTFTLPLDSAIKN